MEIGVGEEWKCSKGEALAEINPNMRSYGGVKKCESKRCGSKKCGICACSAGVKCE